MMQRRFELEVEGAGTIPSELENAVASCLAKDPGKRPQRASELAARIHPKDVRYYLGAAPFLDKTSTTTKPPSVPAIQTPLPNSPSDTISGLRRRKAVVAIVFIIVMLLASIAVILRDRHTALMAERETFAPTQPGATLSAIAAPSLPLKTVSSPELKQSPSAVATPAPSPNSSAESASDQRLTKFTHAKYAFTVLVPATVFPQPPEQLNTEHVIFTSADRKTRMELKVERATRLADSYREWTAERTKEHPHRAVAYKVMKSTWFVVSGDEDGRGFYFKCVARGPHFISMLLEYDEEDCPIWQDTLTTMSRGFDGTLTP
jgi:serine/threonine protein kinase